MDVTFDPPLSVLLDTPWSLCATDHTQGTKAGNLTTVALLETQANGQCCSRFLDAFSLKAPASRSTYAGTCATITGMKAEVIDTALQQLYGQIAPHLKRRTPKAIPPSAPAVDPAGVLGTVSPCTHVANARRLVLRYQPTLRYVVGIGWILWTGQFWRPDPTTDAALATGFVDDLAQTIAAEAAVLYTEASKTTHAGDRKALYTLAMERGHWAAQSEQAATMAAGLKLAKHALLLEHDAINTDPWLFNCQNGTLNLRTGDLQPHSSTDLITHMAPVTHDPTATCPTWEQFLLEVFASDPAMVAFIQRAIGWCLTGVVEERALFLLYGAQGHNGKTTLVEVVRDLLGTSSEEGFGYARKVDVMTFMKSKNYEDNLRKAAQLAGARFVYSSEIDEEHRLNEQLIKDMTGGDTMEARRLYKEAFNFKPTFKPWMYGNHKPEIRGTDDAIWGRVKLVEFPVSFADRVDHKLPEKLRKELSGILNWAVTGCLAWQQEGLNPPAKVQAATEAYRREQDTIGQFISECCQTGKAYMQCKATVLYKAYRKWTEANDSPTSSQKGFGTYLTTHGYPSDGNTSGRGALRQKIALLASEEEDADDEKPATLVVQRVAGTNASNGATKPQSTTPNATLATLGSGKTPHEEPILESPESKGSKGSNSPHISSQAAEKEWNSSATHQNAKGSTFDAKGSIFSEKCPKCPCTALLELGAYRKCPLCGWKGSLDKQSSPPAFTTMTLTDPFCGTCQANVAFRTVPQLDGGEVYVCETCDSEVGRKAVSLAPVREPGEDESDDVEVDTDTDALSF